MKIDLNLLSQEIALYKHIKSSRVEFSDVDSFGVVHNLTYPYWIEWARTDYLFTIGMPLNNKTFTKENPLMTVHTELNYFNSLKFTDTYHVLTRLSEIGKSSITFRNLILNDNKEIILLSSSVLVYVHAENSQAIEIPDHLRKQILDYEKENIKNKYAK